MSSGTELMPRSSSSTLLSSSSGCLFSALFFYLCHRYEPEKFGFPTPHCAARFPPYLGSADVLSTPTSGGARGGVSAALAALSGRHYVDRPAVLFQFCTRAVH